MPTPTLITELSQTAGSNFPSGGDTPSVLDDVQRAHASFIALLRDGKGFTSPVTLASATTTDIGAQNSFFVEISGTTTITSLGTNYNGPRFLRFTGILTLTYNATTLITPGAASITTAAGDTCIAMPAQALNGWTIVSYQRAALAPGVATSAGSVTNGLYTTDLGVTVQAYDIDTVKKDVANTFTATQTPDNGTASVSTTSTYTFDGADQVREITLTNAITVTFGAPTGITQYAMYKFILKAGDTSARTYAWNSAYKFPSATSPLTSGTTTNGAFDIITFIGGASNTLIYDGYVADVR